MGVRRGLLCFLSYVCTNQRWCRQLLKATAAKKHKHKMAVLLGELAWISLLFITSRSHSLYSFNHFRIFTAALKYAPRVQASIAWETKVSVETGPLHTRWPKKNVTGQNCSQMVKNKDINLKISVRTA